MWLLYSSPPFEFDCLEDNPCFQSNKRVHSTCPCMCQGILALIPRSHEGLTRGLFLAKPRDLAAPVLSTITLWVTSLLIHHNLKAFVPYLMAQLGSPSSRYTRGEVTTSMSMGVKRCMGTRMKKALSYWHHCH